MKQFCHESNKLWYCDIPTKEIQEKDKRRIFVQKYLYQDTTNTEDDMQIEKDLAKYETEVSQILSRQVYLEPDVFLSMEETEKLKLFYAIMGFRSLRAADFFRNCKIKEFDDYYLKYQKDEDFEQLWKRNLKFIVNCRSIKAVMDNKDIDEPFKVFMKRDAEGYIGSYLKIVETEKEEFILTDSYPLVITGTNRYNLEVPTYAVFPISPKRAILNITVGMEINSTEILLLRKGFFTQPEKTDKANVYKYHVKKISDEEVKNFNKRMYSVSSIGIIASNKELIEKMLREESVYKNTTKI